jgi:hypothetical protein
VRPSIDVRSRIGDRIDACVPAAAASVARAATDRAQTTEPNDENERADVISSH